MAKNAKGFGNLLTPGLANTKTALGEGKKHMTAIMHLAPHKQAGVGNTCAFASPGCIDACLNTAGRGRFDATQNARNNRTIYFYAEREAFKALLVKEIAAHERKAKRNGKIAAVRLNGTSDILWEIIFPELFAMFPDVVFYDYTKAPHRCMKSYRLPANYHLTFSRSEENDADCRRVLRSGKCNVAVVFENDNYPTTFMGKKVFSMDGDDKRFLDPPGGQVGALYAKGKGKKDNSGFAVPTCSLVKLGGA
ncbi:MAG: hypothetical protein GY743_23020 [Planctomycetaceae bacterium]|nr:hypothetical protein [Planctomycetaceae bacterium]